jgi:PEP-CTERM motif-containing protein
MVLRYLCTAAALLLLSVAMPAGATPIGPPPLSCASNTCQGSIYELTYSGSPIPPPSLASTATTQTFEITLTINPTAYNGGGAFINAVAPKVSSMVDAVTLVSAPGGSGNWATMMGGINAGGCSGSGSGFVCAKDRTPPQDAPVPFAGTYSWVFDLTIPTGTLLTGANAASVKVQYTDSSGNKVGALVSEPITLEVIPEPSTLLLVAGGLAFLARRGCMTQ